MPIFRLDPDVVRFPHPELADEQTGILAIGGDLRPERLLAAYALGIFPWYDEAHSPILWHAPSTRMILRPEEIHVSRSLRKVMRQGRYEVRYDTAFERVISACAETSRPGQDGTWLNQDMQAAYTLLHRLGFAHSAEAWQGDELVGGLYGISLRGVFCGESMFSHARDASKVVFATTLGRLHELGFQLVDCQVYTDHLASLGAYEVAAETFRDALAEALTFQPARVWPGD